jgi:hypothetical protein
MPMLVSALQSMASAGRSSQAASRERERHGEVRDGLSAQAVVFRRTVAENLPWPARSISPERRRRPTRACSSTDHHARCAGLLADKLVQQLLRCAPALAALDQGVGNEAGRIDGAITMALRLAVDRDHDRAAMPLVTEPGRAPTDLAGVDPSGRLHPTPRCFVADDASARCQKVLDQVQAQRKTDREGQTACSRPSTGKRWPRAMDFAVVIADLTVLLAVNPRILHASGW